MKAALLLVLLFSFVLLPPGQGKLNLLCYTKWKQVGVKNFHKPFEPLTEGLTEEITFKNDGSYVRTMYGRVVVNGRWKFTTDSLKLLFVVDRMNSVKMQPVDIRSVNPTDSIIKLTADSLIVAHLAYMGDNRTYGHDDWYYISEK